MAFLSTLFLECRLLPQERKAKQSKVRFLSLVCCFMLVISAERYWPRLLFKSFSRALFLAHHKSFILSNRLEKNINMEYMLCAVDVSLDSAKTLVIVWVWPYFIWDYSLVCVSCSFECPLTLFSLTTSVIDSCQRLNPNFVSALEVRSSQFASIQQWAARAGTPTTGASIFASPEGKRYILLFSRMELWIF